MSTTPTPRGPTLYEAVAAALDVLVDLSSLPTSVTDGRLEGMLMAALDSHGQLRHRSSGPQAHAAAAVRTACAHLATRSAEDAYLALRIATDHLVDRARDASG